MGYTNLLDIGSSRFVLPLRYGHKIRLKMNTGRSWMLCLCTLRLMKPGIFAKCPGVNASGHCHVETATWHFIPIHTIATHMVSRLTTAVYGLFFPFTDCVFPW